MSCFMVGACAGAVGANNKAIIPAGTSTALRFAVDIRSLDRYSSIIGPFGALG